MASFTHKHAKPRIYGYLRVSGKSQIEGDGFPRQKATIAKYATANELRVAEWFPEEGISGTPIPGPRRPFCGELYG